jgi:hypothetical protein
LLVAVCYQLQRTAGDEPFYLACRSAAEVAGTDYQTVNRWINMLLADGVLKLVEKGTQGSGKASRFRYVGEKGGGR